MPPSPAPDVDAVILAGLLIRYTRSKSTAALRAQAHFLREAVGLTKADAERAVRLCREAGLATWHGS